MTGVPQPSGTRWRVRLCEYLATGNVRECKRHIDGLSIVFIIFIYPLRWYNSL
jgi:hypothetical protein